MTQLPHQALAQVFQDRPSGGQLGQTIPDPQPVPLLAPTPEYTLPVLTLDLYTTPSSVTVGMTTTIQIMLENSGQFAATNVLIQLPLPPGVQLVEQSKPVMSGLAQTTTVVDQPDDSSPPAVSDPYPAPGQDTAQATPEHPRHPEENTVTVEQPTIQAPSADHSQDQVAATPAEPPLGLAPYVGPQFAPGRDPEWKIGQLDAQTKLMVTATVQVLAPQADGAVLFAPQVTAQELKESISKVRGTLVTESVKQDDRGRFSPGQAARVVSRDGRVRVTLPEKAAPQALELRISNAHDMQDELAKIGSYVPNGSTFGYAALDPIILEARDDQGKEVHAFDQPVVLEVAYTEAQLRARGLHEGLLTLAFFNEQTLRWQPVGTTIDTKTHTARAETYHFSAWKLQDASNPAALYVPSLQGFQVSSFTGAASYAIPMALPAGAAGHVPNMELSYSSAATDGTSGMRSLAQAGWVGKGWNLSVGGSVALVQHPNGEDWDYYTFSFGGKSYDIARGTQIQGTAGDMNPVLWTWSPIDEGDFLKVRAVAPGTNGSPFDWVLWTKDGTRFEFRRALYTAESYLIKSTPPTENDRVYIYQWLLTRVVDVNGNRIDYSYAVQGSQFGAYMTHPTYYLADIFWAYDTMGTDNNNQPLAGGFPRYNVHFEVTDKIVTNVDKNWEYQSQSALGTPVGTRFKDSTPHERWRLDGIQIRSRAPSAAAYELGSEYRLSYYDSAQSVKGDWIEASNQFQLTLFGVQRFDKNGWQNGATTAVKLPATTFTYGTTPGTTPYYAPDYNRLITVNNGQGGQMTISYANTFESQNQSGWNFVNYQRVTQILRQETSGKSYSRSYLTTYDYRRYDTGPDSARMNDQYSSAKWWYAAYTPGGLDDSAYPRASYLAHTENTEFRGHGLVTVREYGSAMVDPSTWKATSGVWTG